jgi:integrase/uncharacterized protein YlaI
MTTNLQNNLACPSCGSRKIWKNGLKYGIQTYLCRDCSGRFLDSTQKRVIKFNVSSKSRETLNSRPDFANINVSYSDLCVKKTLNDLFFSFREDVSSHVDSQKSMIGKNINAFLPIIGNVKSASPLEDGAKNLTSVEPQIEALAGGTKLTESELKGKLIEFIWWLKKQKKNYSETTINKRAGIIRTLYNCGANLYDPTSVILTVRMQKWCDGTKANVICAYASFCRAFNIPVDELPKYDQTPKLPFIPLEREIDQLIASGSKKVSTFLQTLKETTCRSGEAWKLEWIDIDNEHNVVTINKPEKHGLPRQIKVSSKLISMIQALPKTSKHVFGEGKLRHFRKNFIFQRRRVAKRLQNPRIEQIHFHTLRHWGATMLYHKTKSILHVKERLGHKSIQNTMIYTHLVTFEADEYITKRTNDINEAEELLKAGFDYVMDMEGYKLFRKRK